MFCRNVRLLASMCLLVMAAPALAGVDGQCQYEGRTATFVDGVAWPVVDQDSGEATGERLLVFSTYGLDTDAIWRAPPLQREDAFREQDTPSGDSARLQVTLDADGAVTQMYLWLSPGTNLSRGGTDIGTYVAGKGTATTGIAGRYAFADAADDPACTLTFDLAVLGDAASAPPLPGQPLPADGGEPGRAYLALNRAIHAGDIDAMLAMMPPSKAAELGDLRQHPDFAMQVAFAKAMAPTDVHITGGRVHEDRAWVEFTATEGGQPRAGTAEMMREAGHWYLVTESTRDPE